ncbi:bifunctional adenosylcobinamide kinase/adenosylcobinamide-phosphate guanylyltransferase [Vreelandella aquamarina]
MQLFIGGACAGKRDAVNARFPDAVWLRLSPGQRLHLATREIQPNTPLVVYGVFEWLDASLSSDSDRLRAEWREDLQYLDDKAQAQGSALVLIMNELGKGIVPIERNERRLRDVNGWLSQDATAQATQVFCVRHGLVHALKP